MSEQAANEAGNEVGSITIALPDCITALARKRHGHPQRDRIVVLIGQCRNYGKYPGLGARILETIEAIEGVRP